MEIIITELNSIIDVLKYHYRDSKCIVLELSVIERDILSYTNKLTGVTFSDKEIEELLSNILSTKLEAIKNKDYVYLTDYVSEYMSGLYHSKL